MVPETTALVSHLSVDPEPVRGLVTDQLLASIHRLVAVVVMV